MGLVPRADGRAGLVTVPVRTATGRVISLRAAFGTRLLKRWQRDLATNLRPPGTGGIARRRPVDHSACSGTAAPAAVTGGHMPPLVIREPESSWWETHDELDAPAAPPSSGPTMTVAVLHEREAAPTPWWPASPSLPPPTNCGDLRVGVGRRARVPAVIAGLRGHLPRHHVVAVHVRDRGAEMDRHAASLEEFLDAGSLPVAVTAPTSVPDVTARSRVTSGPTVSCGCSARPTEPTSTRCGAANPSRASTSRPSRVAAYGDRSSTGDAPRHRDRVTRGTEECVPRSANGSAADRRCRRVRRTAGRLVLRPRPGRHATRGRRRHTAATVSRPARRRRCATASGSSTWRCRGRTRRRPPNGGTDEYRCFLRRPEADRSRRS